MTLSQYALDDLFINVGIDSIGFYSPRFYISLENLAKVRDVNPTKYKYGLMTHEMRIPDLGEDCVSLGVKASYNALIRGNINPKEIDAVFVGTEATIYAVKSISNIFKDVLGLADNCMTQDVSNACAASTIAIVNAVAMIEMGIIQKALVISIDISKYDLNSPGEPTQGAGSVAMVLTRNPRIAVFGKNFGKVSSNINDFYRPEGETNAQVFGQYSVSSYLQLQLDVHDDLLSKMGSFYADFYIFHAPYAKLPLKLLQKLFANRALKNIDILMHHDHREQKPMIELPYFNELPHDFIISQELKEKIHALPRTSKEKEIIEKWIYDKIKHTCLPPLQIPALFGNMYSAAIWAELMYLLENYVEPYDTIYFGSYGSGATAVSGIMKIQPEFQTVVNNSLRMTAYLQDKEQKSVEMYEHLRLFPDEIKLQWVKITSENDFPITLNYCDEGCNISQYSGLNFCPKGHSGSNLIKFPIYGHVTDIKPFDGKNLALLKEGYVFGFEWIKKGDLVEFEFRRWRNKYESNPKHGLLNWMPIYRPAPNSPYLNFASEQVEGIIDEEILVPSTLNQNF